MTWLTGWNYRKPITISNSGSALTDYQVSITVDTATLVTAGKLQSTCNDIRFTSSDSLTSLNYWIESGPNTVSTKIWVKITSILASPYTTTIYMYYGNTGATSASNGINTFIFFDDFNGNTYTDRWTVVQQNSYSAISESSGNLNLSHGGGPGYCSDGVVVSATGLSSGSNIEYIFKIASLSGDGYQSAAISLSGSGSWQGYYSCSANALIIPANAYQLTMGGTGIALNNIASSVSTNVASGSIPSSPFWLKIIYQTPNIVVYYSTNSGSSWTQSLSYGSAISKTGTIGMLTGGCCDHAGTLYINEIIARQSVPTAPTVSVEPGEQIPPGSLRITSTPSGALIYVALHNQTPASTGIYTPDPVTNLPPGYYDIRLTKNGYADWTFGNAEIVSNTEMQISATMATLANIGALSMTVSPPSESPCRAGICTVDVSVTWKNTGGLSGLSDLSITVSGGTPTITLPVYSSVSFAANEEITRTFTVSNMIAGTHSICPNPN